MRLMARRADVLHGVFIQPSGPSQSIPATSWFSKLQRYLGFWLPVRR
jgi:hypothetical protein